ncbi:MAG: sel1 repeat family protein [Chitinispirillales bacterium]|nr:sel1 repeat family protein [Chitinispirillales bacterium]
MSYHNFKGSGDEASVRLFDEARKYIIERDWVKAAPLLKEAAERGHAQAQALLAELYEDGKGVPQNEYIAFRWYKRAAEQGHTLAQNSVGTLFYNGVGVKKNKRKAHYWFSRAAEKGDELALRNLQLDFGGCYIATCVYGSYNCHQVRTLRRYRDTRLSKSCFGRLFIQGYYVVSPKIVESFGNKKWFNGVCKPILDKIIYRLQSNGVDCSPYMEKALPNGDAFLQKQTRQNIREIDIGEFNVEYQTQKESELCV